MRNYRWIVNIVSFGHGHPMFNSGSCRLPLSGLFPIVLPDCWIMPRIQRERETGLRPQLKVFPSSLEILTNFQIRWMPTQFLVWLLFFLVLCRDCTLWVLGITSTSYSLLGLKLTMREMKQGDQQPHLPDTTRDYHDRITAVHHVNISLWLCVKCPIQIRMD